MGRCGKCSVDYPLLNTETCFVCRSIEGKSDVEKGNIKKTPKCSSCSLIYSELERPLCQVCVYHWVDQNIIPASLTRLSGVVEQIQQVRGNSQLLPLSSQASATANGVLSLAHEYRQNASQPRLGHQVTPVISRPQSSSLWKATLAGAANRTLTETQAVITAANQKRQGSIHLFASLWVARKKKAGERLEMLDRYNVDKMFIKEDIVINALESCLVMIREVYEKTNPGRSGDLTTSSGKSQNSNFVEVVQNFDKSVKFYSLTKLVEIRRPPPHIYKNIATF
ncbi:hypothetical protein K435DRAFT_858309 [Dendrothele bispora CBS 962.96]|uniref:Uncharacterized protein n=1 Tax=Dendrothele bispora (strain CBS 962.96) TaxID=1314807 RepID=A0A4S8M4J8_DENBC|nr:hypothetical protein K435DRAFT_858309 [Dendrothele bispora CBS 962.96]